MSEVFGRIDVHSHLLPGIDDGCRDVAESIACARKMVAAGYTHSFCTPHIWPNLPDNQPGVIARRVAELQTALDAHGIGLTLLPGGELNLNDDLSGLPIADVVTYGTLGRFCVFDFWCDLPPKHLWPTMERWLAAGIQPILAHPERVSCFQTKPSRVDEFRERGIWVQGNLQCFADAPGSKTRTLAERYLADGVYQLLGSDLHRLDTLDHRLVGLQRAIELAGDQAVDDLTKHQPRRLLPD